MVGQPWGMRLIPKDAKLSLPGAGGGGGGGGALSEYISPCAAGYSRGLGTSGLSFSICEMGHIDGISWGRGLRTLERRPSIWPYL